MFAVEPVSVNFADLFRNVTAFACGSLFLPGVLAQGPPQPPPLQPLNAPAAPAGNAVTADKARLGKALFWDAQLSSTRTVSCGTCHQPSAGGSDPRSQQGNPASTHPGADGLPGTDDDITGSPGVVANNSDGSFAVDDFFGMTQQVTGRYAPTVINAGFVDELFWDGRASTQFRDPISNAVVLNAGAALESQAAGPPTSDVEMAHAGRDWVQIVDRVKGSKPLTLATDIPSDLDAWIDNRNYPALFADAFGDADVTASRIIMAIATYERTLLSNEAAIDDFIANEPNALTAQEEQGRQVFNRQGDCARCHSGNRFTDDEFHFLGVRPGAEDIGRQEVTGNQNHRGQMKTPTLRNAELKNDFMSDGSLATLAEVVEFYDRGGDFETNRNAINPLNLSNEQKAALVAFLGTLTDSRVENGTAPFDPPGLFADSDNQATLGGTAVVGTGSIEPVIVAIEPPLKGNPNFTVGLSDALAGAAATLIVDDAPIGSGAIPEPGSVLFRFDITLDAEEGFGSVPFAIPGDAQFDGLTLHAKWFIADAAASNNLAETQTATFTVFSESAGEVAAPTNLSASDGASATQIDLAWDEVTDAESYQIFRNDSWIGTSEISSFTDEDVAANETFFYQVVAVTSTEASAKSAVESGDTYVVPGAPENLTATDGTDTETVAVSWSPVGDAVHYSVSRAGTDNSTQASELGTTTGTNFSDVTAQPGTVYFYFVRAIGTDDSGAFSVGDSGFRGVTAPENLTASDNANTSHVSLDWSAVSGAQSYTVHRGSTDTFADANELTDAITATSHLDTTATAGVIYYYWVTASANDVAGAASQSDSGYLALESPSSFTASSNYTSHIALSWAPVNGASSYQLIRSTSSTPDGANATLLGTISGTSFNDSTALPEVSYSYFIQAQAGSGVVSDELGPVNGYRLPTGDIIDTPDDEATEPSETDADYDSSAAGKYWGLLHDSAATDGETSLFGYASAKITHHSKTAVGSASIALVYQGEKYQFRGTVEADGSFAVGFVKKDTTEAAMNLSLQLVDTDKGGKLIGQLVGDSHTTELDLFHREFHNTRNPDEHAGRYTFVMPTDPNADSADLPGGDGVAAGKLSSAGVAKLSAVLGDGSKATMTAYASPDDELMFYQTLYKGAAAGYLGGKMTLREVDNVSAADGILQWVKSADDTQARYAAGFDIQQAAVAAAYTAPNTKAKELIISEFSDAEPNALFSMIGENIGVEAKEIVWTTANKFSSSGDVTINARASSKTGLVSGNYIDNSNGFSMRYYAVAFQSQGLITGNFAGSDQSGYVRIEPAGHPSLQMTRASNGIELRDGDSIAIGSVGTDGGIGEIDFLLANAGSGNLKFLSAAELIGNNAGFSIVASNPGVIPGGQSAILRLRFDPVAQSGESIVLRIETNDENNSPLQVTVSATGIAGTGSLFDHAPGIARIASAATSAAVANGVSAEWDAATQAGTYQGLLLDSSTANATRGYASLKVSASKASGLGSVSGSVYVNGEKVTLRGSIGTDGVFTTSSISDGYRADLAIVQTANGSQLVGTISEVGTGDAFALTTARSGFHAKNNPATETAGRYTMLLPANLDLGADFPGGDGYATVKVATSGKISASYRLGDGTRTTTSSKLTADLQWTVFKFLYGSKEGILAGTMTLQDHAGVSDFDGELEWQRPADSKAARFENGFTIRVKAIGSVYLAPATGERMLPGLVDGDDNAKFRLQRAGLDILETTTWDSANQVARTGTLSATPNTKTGAVSGSYLNGPTSVKFYGVVFQKQNLGAGMFTHGAATGYFELQAVEN